MSGRNTPTPQIYSMPFCGKSQIILWASSFQKDGCRPHARHGRIQTQRGGKIHAFSRFSGIKRKSEVIRLRFFAGAEKRIRTSGRVTPVTRFPIVLLKPLRHLCKAKIILQQIGKKSNCFCPLLQIFPLVKGNFLAMGAFFSRARERGEGHWENISKFVPCKIPFQKEAFPARTVDERGKTHYNKRVRKKNFG